MKPVKIFLLLLCLGLFAGNTFKALAEEWKSVFDTGKVESRQPEKKLYKSDGFVVHATSGRSVTTGGGNRYRKPLNIVFVKGFNVDSLISNDEYQIKVKTIFKGHNVSFICLPDEKLTKANILKTFVVADILVLDCHASLEPFNGMQWMSAALLDAQGNLVPDKYTRLTSGEIKNYLKGKKKPKLVVFNTCYGVNGKIKDKNDFAAAFGIDKETRYRAFVSWMGPSRGYKLDDRILNLIFKDWVIKDENGKYPRLKDIFTNRSSLDPYIIGDLNTRFIDDEYFVLFQLTIPKPKKEFEKIERGAEESDPEWTARREKWQKQRAAYYQGLTYSDFDFVEKPLEKLPLVINVIDKGMEYYPEDFFAETIEFAIKINGTTKTDDSKRVPLKGALLLKRRGIYQSLDQLLEENPSLDRAKLKVALIDQDNGRIRRIGKAGEKDHFTADVIEKGWTKQDKVEAVNLAKAWLMFFDCFVAHAVYDDAHAKPITVFRNFRDQVLKKSQPGRHLVRLYYEYGPEYAVRLRNNPEYIPYVRWCLDRFSSLLEGVNLDSAEACSDMLPFIVVADKIASVFFKEGASNGFGQLAGMIEPQIWY